MGVHWNNERNLMFLKKTHILKKINKYFQFEPPNKKAQIWPLIPKIVSLYTKKYLLYQKIPFFEDPW